jgi:hypothetical protein
MEDSVGLGSISYRNYVIGMQKEIAVFSDVGEPRVRSFGIGSGEKPRNQNRRSARPH